MDSISNLSLLEIAGEDDSLLLDSGRDDSTVTTATNVFSCSPLLSLRSLPPRPPQNEGTVGATVDSENLISSPKHSVNKENMNWSKAEAPKLSVEPQQMKRKKKGGGYNLRKSLAWDRAFFTEEGVLNPLELSMISGTATPNRNNAGLNVIHEEEPASASFALQEIEENLFKQSSGGVSIQDRKIGAGLSPKPSALTKDAIAPASVAKRKVLAVNDVVGNRSKRSACPRPVASSSQKRPDAAKAPSKESKVTKIPGPKSNVSVITTASRSGTLSTGLSKRNQNAHPATNVQKYAGLKSLSKNPRTVQSNPKVDLADKCSIARTLTRQAGRHLDNSVSETHPPSRLHQPGTGANKLSEVCLPQGVSHTGEKKQQTQFQTTKASGLRMPSPSLGFFSQAKASSSRSQSQKSKPCKPAESNIHKLRKLETNSVNEARLPHAPRKRSEIVKGAAKNCTKKLNLSDIKSEPSMQVDNKQMAGLEVECDSLCFEKISKQEMVDNKQMAGIEVECNSLGFEKISKREMVENILEHVNIKSKELAELHKNDNVSNMEDVEFPRHEQKLLSKSHTHEQLQKEADHPLEDELYDVLSNGHQPVFQEPQSMHHHSMQRTLTGKDNISNTVHNAMGQDEDEQIKLLTCDVLTSNESLVLQAKHDTSKDSRHAGEFKEYDCVKTALVNSSLNEAVLEGSIQGIPYKNTEQVNDGAGDFGKCGGDAQLNLLNVNLSVNCNDNAQSILKAVNQQLQGEKIKTPNSSIVGEISSKNGNESHVNSCKIVHVTTLSSEGSPEMSIPEIDSACESEPKIAEIEDCKHPVDGQSGFIQRRPVDEGYDQVIDSKAMDDQTQAFELDRMCEDCITVSSTACNNEVNNVFPESRPFYENNLENLRFTSQLCPMVKADCDSRGNDMSINNRCTISAIQLRDDSSSRDTSMHCDLHRDVPGNSEQQASTLTYSETNEMLCEDESLVANHGHLLDESEFSEMPADFISNTKDSVYSGAENPSGLLQHTQLAQSVREFDHTNRESKESHLEDEPAQYFDENPVVYNCSNEQCLSVTKDQFSLANDNNINEESHLSELQRSSLVGVDSQQVNNVLHLDGDWLPANTAFCEEIKKKNLFEDALEGCNIYTSEHNASDHHTQAMPENKDGNLDVDERTERLQMGDAKKGSTDILSFEVQLNNKVISAEFDSSIKVSEDRIAEVVDWKSDENCSLSENSKLPASDDLTFHARIPQGSEVSSLNSQNFSEEAETNIFEKDEFPNTDMQHQTKGGIYFAEDNSKTIHLQKSATKSRQEVPIVKPPPNAAPFSDEWLAAIEAAGEEILTIKSGAVQNSPPDKPQHEPGPWSPVRRKNQAIGPFDCTKHANIPPHPGS